MRRYITLLLFIGLAFWSCEEEVEEALPDDCAGVEGGSALVDSCGVCVGGTTGNEACVDDCFGDLGGTAVINPCDICAGGNTGIPEDSCASVTDIDGNIYNTVIIGSQAWMVQNLRVTHYLDGSEITTGLSGSDWADYWYGVFATNGDPNVYGYLYDWYATINSSGLVPEGWRLPTKSDFEALLLAVGNDPGKLKEAGYEHWNGPNVGATNESGWTALPNGQMESNGYLYNLGDYGFYWTSTTSEYTDTYAWELWLLSDDTFDGYSITTKNKKQGLSVRCIKE